MKRVSVYIKGGQSSPSYYRIYQYINRLSENLEVRYRQMYPPRLYEKYMPISQQSLYIKLFLAVCMYIRNLYYLFLDFIHKPDVVVITRRVAVRIMPAHYKWLLRQIGKKSYIIWDYDDQIIAGQEVSRQTFNFYAAISDRIFCTHSYLAELIADNYRQKVVLLPTTDGDMYSSYNETEMRQQRLSALSDEVRLVWVATCVNLRYLQMVAPWLDNIAKNLQHTKGKTLSLEVICNGTLDYDFKYLRLTNTTWTRQRAIDGMLHAHIGIMPLADSEFTRGKGGFKLVQYLSVGLPCISSNVGFNKQVINEKCGFLAESEEQWQEAIFYLSDPAHWIDYSTEAVRQWNQCFSFDKNLAIWKQALASSKEVAAYSV